MLKDFVLYERIAFYVHVCEIASEADGLTIVLRLGARDESPRIPTMWCSDLQLCFYLYRYK
jgi:hypothetical protein